MKTLISDAQREVFEAREGGPIPIYDHVMLRKYALMPWDDYNRLVDTLVEFGIPLEDVFHPYSHKTKRG